MYLFVSSHLVKRENFYFSVEYKTKAAALKCKNVLNKFLCQIRQTKESNIIYLFQGDVLFELLILILISSFYFGMKF